MSDRGDNDVVVGGVRVRCATDVEAKVMERLGVVGVVTVGGKAVQIVREEPARARDSFKVG